MQMNKVRLSKAECSLDLGDGSERAFYVNQDYILRKLQKIHRGISLMYTYYPNDKTWPVRASKISTQKKANGSWDYDYEDYFPYLGGRLGKRDDEPFNFMKEIRRHGQDVILTMTIDPFLKEEDIITIAKDLRPYGRILLRVNHECTGSWFCYTKRATYEQIADFFVMVCKVMHKWAPNVKMILCAGMWDEKTGKLEMEDIFLEAHKQADIWSGDNYLALNWGWPGKIATKQNSDYAAYDVDKIYQKAKNTLYRLREITGQNKPFVLSEMNADGDVLGPFEQSNYMCYFMELLEKDSEKWLDAFTLYQFRDDGRLGLEITDPNNSEVGIEQPLLKKYRQQMQKEFFSPKIDVMKKIELPAKLRWGSTEDSEGLEINCHFNKTPTYFEIVFDGDLLDMNIMMEFSGYWFYKAPGVKRVDLMSYFFENEITNPKDIPLRFFCPPKEGVNQINEDDENYDVDLLLNDYTVFPKIPEIRIEEEPVQLFKKYF